GVKAGGDFQAPLVIELVIELVAPFYSGPICSDGYRRRRRIVRLRLVSFYDARASANAGGIGERKILFEAGLRQPEPHITRTGEGGNANLRQRRWFARIEDRL